MYIQDALNKTGIVTPDYINSKKESYAKLFDGILYWYSVKRDEYYLPVTLQGINNINWQPYHPKEEIRPSEAGELWKYNNVKYMTMVKSVSIAENLFMKSKYDCFCAIAGSIEVIHNQNGWERLHPPVNDEEVNETLVFKDVEWSRYRDECIAPMLATGLPDSLINKPRMTMTLTIPKENS